jgi:hypothetical protein
VKLGGNDVICTAAAPSLAVTNYGIVFGCREVAEGSKSLTRNRGLQLMKLIVFSNA